MRVGTRWGALSAFAACFIGEPGVPDGMKVDAEGNLFCTGPGGLHVFAPNGQMIA